MNYPFLGTTGIRISEIGLGTMGFGWETDEKTSYVDEEYRLVHLDISGYLSQNNYLLVTITEIH